MKEKEKEKEKEKDEWEMRNARRRGKGLRGDKRPSCVTALRKSLVPCIR